MTTITIHRALLKQALNVLTGFEQNYGSLWYSSYEPDQIDSVCSALRAELAKPVEQAEPVAWLYSVPGHRSSASCERIPLDMTPRGTAEAPLYLHPPTPAWHDAPTEPGIWLCDEGGPDCYTWTAHNIVLLNDPALKDDECRWYGPIPQDGAKAEGGAA